MHEYTPSQLKEIQDHWMPGYLITIPDLEQYQSAYVLYRKIKYNPAFSKVEENTKTFHFQIAPHAQDFAIELNKIGISVDIGGSERVHTV